VNIEEKLGEQKFGGILSNLDGRLINTLFNIDINKFKEMSITKDDIKNCFRLTV